jgi:NAD(P)-dependent dehydrogenase (short-subunit alcohol dehydrogenase family)
MQRVGKELEGKVCVITGGGRGIGAAIATTFAAHGARVALLERDATLAEETRSRLAAEGVDVRSYTVDVTDEAGIVNVAQQVASDFGAVNVLVNNAGISRLGPSMSFSTQDFRDSMEVLTIGVFICSREFGKQLRKSGGGAIVNISSINGIVAFPMRLAYSAAKAAVISMTEVLATEWAGYGIRVNAVAPGVIKTEMVKQVIDEGLIDVKAYEQHTPLRRFGRPEEIAEAVLFLASERSSFITGQVVVPDGGWTAFAWIPWSGDPDAPGIVRS